MPINADLGGKSYVLGKGRVYFDRFPNGITITGDTAGEGERYLGNTPEFSTTASSETLDHFSSEAGVRTKDDSVQLSLDRTGSMITDNISSENMALFFQGSIGVIAQTAQTAAISVIAGVQQGRFYQVGVSESLPVGARNISTVLVNKGAGFTTLVTLPGNYQIDEQLGRIYIEEGSVEIPNDSEIQVTYDTVASTREQVVSSSDPIYGALRFVADNPKGENRDFYFPYVKLAPDGDYALKGEEWQQIGFTFDILKKSDNIEAAYIDGRPVVV